MEASLLFQVWWFGSLEPLRMTWPLSGPAGEVAWFVTNNAPIPHTCFWSPVEEGVFEVTLAVMVGIECATAGVIVESCRLAMSWCLRKKTR